MQLLRGKTEHLVLTGPFDWQVSGLPLFIGPLQVDRARRSYVILRNASGKTTQNADKGLDLVVVKTLQPGVRMSITTGVRIKYRRKTLICH
jgi:hypothetical protein